LQRHGLTTPWFRHLRRRHSHRRRARQAALQGGPALGHGFGLGPVGEGQAVGAAGHGGSPETGQNSECQKSEEAIDEFFSNFSTSTG
jgi:hypothetical protein